MFFVVVFYASPLTGLSQTKQTDSTLWINNEWQPQLNPLSSSGHSGSQAFLNSRPHKVAGNGRNLSHPLDGKSERDVIRGGKTTETEGKLQSFLHLNKSCLSNRVLEIVMNI